MKKLDIKFIFAGFNFPRYIPELSRSKYDRRTSRSVYYHAPEPLTGQAHPGQGFYLNSVGSPSRWEWADEVKGSRIEHTGWYSDEYGDCDKIRGLVAYLPHGKMLAGWSMGIGMCGEVGGEVYTNKIEAARAADSIAEYIAEKEREYQAEEQERREKEERRLKECEGGDEEETEGY